MQQAITHNEILQAQYRISEIVRRTSLVKSNSLSKCIDANVKLKLDYLQDTGSFKLRGCVNKLLSLTKPALRNGVITYSTGNHGKAVAYLAKHLGSEATICVSKQTTKQKISALKEQLCNLHIEGESQDEAVENMNRLAGDNGLTSVIQLIAAR